MSSIPPLRSDPEFRPAADERSMPPVPDPAAYRRVLANPFLGLLGVAGWAAALRAALLATLGRDAGFILLLIALVVAARFLTRWFQYHCLDCGRTGRLSGWKTHVCPAVARRIIEGRPRRFRGPSPLVQMLIWGYVLAAVLLLGLRGGVALLSHLVGTTLR